MNYLQTDEVKELLRVSEPSTTTVLTYSVRHSYCERTMRRALTAACDSGNLTICLVPGNSAYLNVREQKRPLARIMREALDFVVRNGEDPKIWVGTEGVLHVATALAVEYGVTPFLLLDRTLESNLEFIRDHGFAGDSAVYVPYYVTTNQRRVLHDVLYRLSGYLVRRRWVREEAKRLDKDLSLPILRNLVQEKTPLSEEFMNSSVGSLLAGAANSLSVYGDPPTVTERLKSIVGLGAKILVGFPIKESEQQVHAFADCLARALQ
jgi:alkanesulfonate monooxygenase SsuD/methylene tetrahydromethanopterin reductase-like flavin-dependent oxidoreductase (luciferase family)